MVRGALASALAATVVCACNDPRSEGGASPPSIATSTRVEPKVAWPTASAVDARALDALGRAGEARALLARSPVPVLAPTNVALERPTFVVEGEYYALTGRVRGATIAIQGTRAAHRYANVEPAEGNRVVRGQRAFVTVNEGIRTTSWMENGAAYSIDVECRDAEDPRCASDAFVLDVAEHLGFAGGSGR